MSSCPVPRPAARSNSQRVPGTACADGQVTNGTRIQIQECLLQFLKRMLNVWSKILPRVYLDSQRRRLLGSWPLPFSISACLAVKMG
jgi:hypothetical protein